MNTNDIFNLPAGPAELCFDKNEFVKKSFSVDEFLHEHHNSAGLEAMRDDLGIYLKVLRSAMIELINEDYADFVNLASNLIGLDNSINGIQIPLGQLKEEIITIKMTLTDTMAELQDSLQAKNQLREHLRSVQSVTKVTKSIEKLDKLLNEQLLVDGGGGGGAAGGGGKNVISEINPTLLERAALDFVQITFDLQFCRNLIEKTPKLSADCGEKKCQQIETTLLTRLEEYFLKILEKKDSEKLEQCLRIYSLLDKTKLAEQIVRQKIVGIYMNSIISETNLQQQGVLQIYTKILTFLTEKLECLLILTRTTTSGVGGNGGKIKGFDFLLNSFWQEVAKRLETHMTSIFAPGNPDLFYQKFQHTLEFLTKLEAIIMLYHSNDGIKRFRHHEQYKSLQKRWNLPVYFQIRYQEIGGQFETICSKPINNKIVCSRDNAKTINKNHNEWWLSPFAYAIDCINKSWSNGVYLSHIFIRFWKLTLQILARLSQWIDECFLIERWQQQAATAATAAASPAIIVSSASTPSSEISDLNCVDFFVYLYIDIKKLLKQLPLILSMVQQNLPTSTPTEQLSLLDDCFMETRTQFELKFIKIKSRIVKELLTVSISSIKQVNDIPRLYRKTNRDVPSKPCSYVDQMLEPAKQFYGKYAEQMEQTAVVEILANIFSTLNKQYYTCVDDLLTSVQKTEESLRRLKNLREKSAMISSVGTTNHPDNPNRMTDDDKIRLQLQVDVIYWSNDIEKLGVPRENVEQLTELINLVEESTKLKITK